VPAPEPAGGTTEDAAESVLDPGDARMDAPIDACSLMAPALADDLPGDAGGEILCRLADRG
jgi:hypothetical protein